MRQRTPQEKKSLSYEKDRRNDYGENDKSSRKNIPLRKVKQNRAFRKAQNQILQKAGGEFDIGKLEIIENEMRSRKKGDWKKVPDAPLGEFVQGKLESRKIRANKGKTLRGMIREILKSLEIEIEQTAGGRWIAMAKNLSPDVAADGETPEIAVRNLRYWIQSAVANALGSETKILVNGKFIKPIL